MKKIQEHLARGDWVAAEQACRDALDGHPEDLRAAFLLAYVLWRQGRGKDALDRCRRLLAAKPGNAGLLSDLGNLLRELGAHEDALSALGLALQLKPGHAAALYNRALVLDQLGREKEALDAIASVPGSDPLYAACQYLGGRIHKDFGETQAAEAAFRACIAANPGHAAAWHALAWVRRFEAGDELLEQAEARLAAPGAPRDVQKYLLFALAKLHDDAGAYEAAAQRLQEANEMVGAAYDRRAIETRLARLLRFRPSPGANTAAAGVRQPAPVFIVGLPRSGTTLVEQQLDRHPRVRALGELDTLPRLIPDPGRPAEAGVLSGCARRYMEALPATGNATIILDKMPENFWRLGHIMMMFPAARVIHCRRDRRDVALSNLFNLYETGNSFAYRVEDIAHYTACHDAIMQHWKAVSPERIVTVDYQGLVAETEDTLLRLQAFLDLEPIQPSEAEAAPRSRRIRTASNWQARQAIYRRSLQRWKNYPKLAESFERHYRSARARIDQGSG